jgi:hypothetical protein
MSLNKTQEQIVIERLREDGFITRNFCLQNYISRLGAIICDLKKQGYEFDAKFVKEKGGKNYYYYLTKQPYQKVTYRVPATGQIIERYEKI